jgi:hypothetical protein
MINLTLEQTIELEKAVEIKKKAIGLYEDFLKYFKIDINNFKDGVFIIWSDSSNKTQIAIVGSNLVYQCRFLHETYNVEISPDGIFEKIKEKYRGIDHLESEISRFKNKDRE